METSEMNRYSRQIILPEFGLEGQHQLKNAKVLIIGAGGLGCPILQYLTSSGVGHIGIVDDDQVSESNLHRQILYDDSDLGKPKVVVAAEKLTRLNPFVKIDSHGIRLSQDNAKDIFVKYDLVIDGSDNFTTRYLVNDTCVALGKPLIFGSILKFEGQVSVFNYQNGPQYRDLFPDPPAEHEVPNCSEIGVIGILPGLIGMYMSYEAIKVICKLGETLSGKLLVINTLKNQHFLFNIQKKNNLSEIKTHIDEQPPYVEIKAEEFLRIRNNASKDILLVDVRESHEHLAHNLGGINIPLNSLSQRYKDIPIGKSIVLYCQRGIRSRSAASFLSNMYQGKIYSLSGGIEAIYE
ncbi:molybdopterin-synthase adenylyltransferase MoeB [Belliella kenyensis]|uniref:Molybdopterin-synthase adenylyltransferase MoeB n=1 Tax=Belliella kenyensis TaxID=1472724 RepID=A0ABV8ER97_9BACT|nr:HesA/MoeB/ThiF family protein [Belliella kenyensis]MCH7403398.1 HesA/MoeB/ThiF family protein [Belliella kenyensis]MDN3601610.1 HesA/MoeB/ThiF family protein [Belliella kenyensis]